MEVFEALALRRKEIGMKYELLSEKSGIPVNTLKKIFTGNIGAPSFESIKSIAYAMDWTLEELDRRIEEKSEYSTEDIALLTAINSLDIPGKAAVKAVLETQQQRIKDYGPAFKSQTVEIVRRRVPMLTGTDESILQVQYHAKQEQRELQQSESIQSETFQPDPT